MSDGDYQTEEWRPSLKELVKESRVFFDSYRQGNFYYNIISFPEVRASESGIPIYPENDIYQFPVPIDDIGTATMLAEDKATLFMRWIRKAIEDKTLIKL